MKVFDKNNQRLRCQFDDVAWIDDSGVSREELARMCNELAKSTASLPRVLQKAELFSLILHNARVAVDKDDIFQDKIDESVCTGQKLMLKQRLEWQWDIEGRCLGEETAEVLEAWRLFGAFHASPDFGHTSANTQCLLELGFVGLLARVERYAAQEGLSEKQQIMYESCRIMLQACIDFVGRLAQAVRPHDEDSYRALKQLTVGAPRNIYEAMQLLLVYFFLHEYVAGARVRTFGRLDVLLSPFYRVDIKAGTYTRDEIREMLKFFLNKIWAAKVPYDMPFALGGIDKDGEEVTNEFSYMVVEAYNELDIHSPKIHIRVSEKTPADFLKLVLRCIRGGNSSFVFVNDKTAMQALINVGIEEKDAYNYVPIGCYEPAVWGMEMGCTGNGGVNLPKAVEFAFTDGVDLKSGRQVSIKTGRITSYEEFYAAVKKHIASMCERGLDYITKIEGYYGEIYPDPMLSAQYDRSVETGVDVYEGGAKYNNSSLSAYSIATLVDSIAAVKRLVFEEGRVTFDELTEILKNDWKGQEKLRLYARSIPEKYGNNEPVTDEIMVDMSRFIASQINNRPNGRGGVFKASLFSIDHGFALGKKTMATPDGRHAGDSNSKNLCAVPAMDKKGITALINSVTKIDQTEFPNGVVLDVVLHPSAVSGEDGLEAFLSILKTYFALGGMALHGNVFDAATLRAAQNEPEKYQTLQVRVCGWNAYFVNLSKAEQDAFIMQAENAV